MSTFTTLHSMLNALVMGKGPTASGVAATVVKAVYDRVRANAPTNASQVSLQHCKTRCRQPTMRPASACWLVSVQLPPLLFV